MPDQFPQQQQPQQQQQQPSAVPTMQSNVQTATQQVNNPQAAVPPNVVNPQVSQAERNKVFIIVFLFMILLLVGGGIFIYFTWFREAEDTSTDQGQAQDESSDDTEEDTEEDSDNAETSGEELDSFENKFMKLSFPKDWNYEESTGVTLVDGESVEEKDSGIILSKDKYRLYISMNTSQASGVEGGRFSEITSHMKGVEVVITAPPPNIPCYNPGEEDIAKVSTILNRTDLYSSSSDEYTDCLQPSEGTIWYGSYITTNADGYFGDVSKLANDPILSDSRQFVITISYEADAIDDFPQKDSDELKIFFEEVDVIVKSIEVVTD